VILHGHDFFNSCPNGGFYDYTRQQPCSARPLGARCLRTQCDKSSYAQKLWRAGREGVRRARLGGQANVARMLLIHPGQGSTFVAAGWPIEKLHAVRNPVDPPCHDRVAAERNHGVLFIGRISAEKGADLAAQAAKSAALPLTFVGDGSERERIRSIYGEARFLGRLDRNGIARALREARVAVMPSRWSEPFGLVALEAIGSGVPVVVNERALMAREIAAAGFGIALDTSNLESFAQTLAALDRDDAKIEAMSLAGAAGYGSLCTTQEQWAQAIIAHYREVLALQMQPARVALAR